jgi:hypothetical protein
MRERTFYRTLLLLRREALRLRDIRAKIASERAEAASRAMTEPEARLEEVRLRHPHIGDELEDVMKMLQEGPFLVLSFLTA